MAISKKQGKEIASLVQSMLVWNDMAINPPNPDRQGDYMRWFNEYAQKLSTIIGNQDIILFLKDNEEPY